MFFRVKYRANTRTKTDPDDEFRSRDKSPEHDCEQSHDSELPEPEVECCQAGADPELKQGCVVCNANCHKEETFNFCFSNFQ